MHSLCIPSVHMHNTKMMNQYREILHQMLTYVNLSAELGVLSSMINEFCSELMEFFLGKSIFQYCLSVICGSIFKLH